MLWFNAHIKVKGGYNPCTIFFLIHPEYTRGPNCQPKLTQLQSLTNYLFSTFSDAKLYYYSYNLRKFWKLDPSKYPNLSIKIDHWYTRLPDICESCLLSNSTSLTKFFVFNLHIKRHWKSCRYDTFFTSFLLSDLFLFYLIIFFLMLKILGGSIEPPRTPSWQRACVEWGGGIRWSTE
jgi:hypothetical protein